MLLQDHEVSSFILTVFILLFHSSSCFPQSSDAFSKHKVEGVGNLISAFTIQTFVFEVWCLFYMYEVVKVVKQLAVGRIWLVAVQVCIAVHVLRILWSVLYVFFSSMQHRSIWWNIRQWTKYWTVSKICISIKTTKKNKRNFINLWYFEKLNSNNVRACAFPHFYYFSTKRQ